MKISEQSAVVQFILTDSEAIFGAKAWKHANEVEFVDDLDDGQMVAAQEFYDAMMECSEAFVLMTNANAGNCLVCSLDERAENLVFLKVWVIA